MSKPLLYDVCCGAGGCTRGYQMAGFRVIGIDHKPFQRYVGDGFIEMDALEFLRRLSLNEFERPSAIHASFPCQLFCSLKSMPNAKKDHLDLITPGRPLLKMLSIPYVIENVPGAPLLEPTMLCGTMFGLGTGNADLRRHRLFETNWPLILPFGMFCKHGRRAASTPDTIGIYGTGGRGRSVSGIGRRRTCTVVGGHGEPGGNAGGTSARDGLLYFSTAERNEAMQIDWMRGGEVSQAIPPPYTEFIGRQLLAALSPGVRP